MEEKRGKEPMCDVKRGDGGLPAARRPAYGLEEGVERGETQGMQKDTEEGGEQEEKLGGSGGGAERETTFFFPLHPRCRKTRSEGTDKQKGSQKEG